jgi:hypothetical protein
MLIKVKTCYFINIIMIFIERILVKGGNSLFFSNFITEMFLHLRSLLLILGMITLVGVPMFTSKLIRYIYIISLLFEF